MTIRITSKVIRVYGPNHSDDDDNEHVVNTINWEQVVDSLNDQLPEYFYCKIEDA